MMRIYKYTYEEYNNAGFVTSWSDGKIAMHKYAKILHIDLQNNLPRIWALVDTNESLENKTFRIFGTGQEVKDPNQEYIGTFLDGSFVFHIFELIE